MANRHTVCGVRPTNIRIREEHPMFHRLLDVIAAILRLPVRIFNALVPGRH
ncbi:MAG: hypothetical protein ACREJB_07960 [Planctomycetaceae bacterium]